MSVTWPEVWQLTQKVWEVFFFSLVSDVVHRFPSKPLLNVFCVVLFRKESRNLGFSVIIDARKSAAKRKYLEDIVEAMVCFQVCVYFLVVSHVNGNFLNAVHNEYLFIKEQEFLKTYLHVAWLTIQSKRAFYSCNKYFFCHHASLTDAYTWNSLYSVLLALSRCCWAEVARFAI